MTADLILDSFLDSLMDSLRLLPFLFVTYLVMEYLEHKTGSKMQEAIRRADRSGPVIGGILGIFPQCGFSAAASNLYAGRIITVGTLMAIFLSTSDEMLPILISENAGVPMIAKILAVKVVTAVAAGFVIDFIFRRKENDMQIEHLCEQHHCHCENGIWKSALHHTLEIFVYILLISLALNLVIAWIGEDVLGSLILNRPVIGPMVAGLVGLIPNCAASVIITKLYLGGVLSAGGMMAGLLAGTGVGVLVLLRVNDDRRENLRLIGLLYVTGVLAGMLIEVLGITF
ncbi:MAG: arsenic efflux protein [Lachnospiraceae bacterium]|nr:arsenic efflux protein [Lachnospiraceae bacterium]